MKYTAIIEGKRVDIELNRSEGEMVEAEIGGMKYVLQVQPVEAGVYWLQWENRSIEISVTPNGEAYKVSINGRALDIEILDSRAALRKAAQQSHSGAVELRAPMPGKVVRVLVDQGTAVEMNQGVLVVEAMKMQNEIKSPKKGVVKKLGVKEGAAVNSGDLLAIVE
jgi:biotin carboxyl carrier protein